MQAFHGDPALKAVYLTRVRYHTEMGHLLQNQGSYYAEVEGRMRVCAVGALTHDRHGGKDDFPALLGLPVEIAHLLEAVFEGASRPYSRTWTARATAAIPVGADLRGVPYHLALWLLGTEGHDGWSLASAPGLEILDDVASLYRARIAGEAVAPAAWRADAYARAVRVSTCGWTGPADLAAVWAAAAAARRAGAVWPVVVADAALGGRIDHLAPTTARRRRHAFWAATGDRLIALLAAAPMAREARPAPTDAAGRAIRAILG